MRAPTSRTVPAAASESDFALYGFTSDRLRLMGEVSGINASALGLKRPLGSAGLLASVNYFVVLQPQVG